MIRLALALALDLEGYPPIPKRPTANAHITNPPRTRRLCVSRFPVFLCG